MNAVESYFGTSGFWASGFLNLTPMEAYIHCRQGALLLDVRLPYFVGFKCFDVPKIIAIPLTELELKMKELPTDNPIIVADSVGLHSHEAMLMLQEAGFKNIANLAGGMAEWEHDGLPIKLDIQYRLSGSCVCQLK
ncbi:MAG: rhodanese-like domain-containing protein [Salinivirgaceae bacterium]